MSIVQNIYSIYSMASAFAGACPFECVPPLEHISACLWQSHSHVACWLRKLLLYNIPPKI
jgi:hypothetical protein